MSVHTAINPTVSFDRYRTFSFGSAEAPPRGYASSPWSPEVRRHVQPLIAATLAQRGYESTPEKGDLVIMFGSGRRTVAVHESSEVGDPSWLPSDENGTAVERSLAIDAFDASTGAWVWHGSSQAEIDPDRANDGMLQRSVSALLAAFPSTKALTASTTTSAASLDVPLNDGQIARLISDIDAARISIAKVAESRASGPQVRAFAMRMERAHVGSEDRLGALMKAEGIAPAVSSIDTELTVESRAQELTLMARSGSDFDMNYVAAQGLSYLYVLHVFDDELLPAVKNATLRSELVETRAELAIQKTAADDLWASLGYTE